MRSGVRQCIESLLEAEWKMDFSGHSSGTTRVIEARWQAELQGKLATAEKCLSEVQESNRQLNR